MYFSPLRSPQTYKFVYHGCLIVFELTNQLFSVNVFHADEETMLYKGNLKNSDLSAISNFCLDGYSLNRLYDYIVTRHQQSIDCLSANRILLRIDPQNVAKSYNDSKERQTPTVSIDLNPTKISEKQSICYIRDYHLTKEQSFKLQILKLKSQIYSLMNELEYVTGLIKSQSVQTKNARLEIKELKKELDGYKIKEKERKSSTDFGVECNLSDEGVEQDPIIKAVNKKVKEMAECVKYDYLNTIGVNSMEQRKIPMFWGQRQIEKNSYLNVSDLKNLPLPKKKIPRTSSQSYINSSRLSGRIEKIDRLYVIDSICKTNILHSS